MKKKLYNFDLFKKKNLYIQQQSCMLTCCTLYGRRRSLESAVPQKGPLLTFQKQRLQVAGENTHAFVMSVRTRASHFTLEFGNLKSVAKGGAWLCNTDACELWSVSWKLSFSVTRVKKRVNNTHGWSSSMRERVCTTHSVVDEFVCVNWGNVDSSQSYVRVCKICVSIVYGISLGKR